MEELHRRRAETRRRRRSRRLLLAGLAVLTVAGAALAVLFTSLGSSHPGASKTAATTTDARAAAAVREALRGKVIVIDPGHNGGNPLHTREIKRLVNAGKVKKPCDTIGTATASGYTEAAYNLDVSLRLVAHLHDDGASTVMLTRKTNDGWGPCITKRAAIANQARADVAISIHADSRPAGGRGFYVIYPSSTKGLTDDIAAASRALALDVRDAFRSGTTMPYATSVGSKGLDRRSDLGDLNLSDVPKVVVETGNMRNTADAALLEESAFRDREAQAIARGIATFLARRK